MARSRSETTLHRSEPPIRAIPSPRALEPPVPARRHVRSSPPNTRFKIPAQLRSININRLPADQLEAAKRRRVGDGARVDAADPREDAPARPADPRAPGDSERRSSAPVSASAPAPAPAPALPASRWSARLPLPKKYELLADVFVALQQVGPLLRKRQQACTADVVCSSVETMTRRRCTVDMLRSVEAIKPGTVSFSVRGDARGSGDARDGPLSPRRVRADVAVPAGTAQGAAGTTPGTAGGSTSATGTSLADAFRAAMVNVVGAHHDAFLARLGDAAANDEEGPVVVDGQVVEWHPKFDLERAPDPPAGPAVHGFNATNATNAQPSAASTADVAEHPRVGNGSAMPANWGRANPDGGDVKARAIAARAVTDEEAAAAAAALGDAGAELPLAAVAAVMKRKAAADHDADPATIAERRRRRLCDLLPSLFDTVRSLFATSRRKVSSFADLLQHVLRTTTRQSSSPTEVEAALRLLAASSPEWCALMPASETVSGEELWRLKTVDVAVTRFVRQKLVAMKEDKL